MRETIWGETGESKLAEKIWIVAMLVVKDLVRNAKSKWLWWQLQLQSLQSEESEISEELL